MYALKDDSEDDPLEVKAINCGLNFIKMDGNIGCLGTVKLTAGCFQQKHFVIKLV